MDSRSLLMVQYLIDILALKKHLFCTVWFDKSHFSTALRGLDWQKSLLCCLARSGLAQVTFLLPGMVWIGQSQFYTARRGLDWPKSILHCLAWSGLAKVTFLLPGVFWIGQSQFCIAWHGLD
jgi:hypothetical protein